MFTEAVPAATLKHGELGPDVHGDCMEGQYES